MIIGLDPGQSTGIAYFVNGKLDGIGTIAPHEILEHISAAALKMARNVGEIDAWCKLIVAHCEHLGIPAHGVSPKGKGAKMDADSFSKLTGWTGRSNAHERDAACIAWPYRGAK